MAGLVEDFGDALDNADDIGCGGLPVANADAHGPASAPGGAGKEGFARGVDLDDGTVGKGVVAGVRCAGAWVEEANHALVDLRDVQGECAG